MEIITLKETDSTNSYCKREGSELTAPLLIRAICQTAGRGQRGNHWESAPGENLTFSIIWEAKGVAPREQFSISEAVALGVKDWLQKYGIDARVKWPNDIYVDDRKICGILIEHSLVGNELKRSIIGIGINVNQEKFISDAPNPVSMRILTGEIYSLSEVLEKLGGCLEERLAEVETESGREKVHEEFKGGLWRGDSLYYPFREKESGRTYKGRIVDVEAKGFLVVESEEGERRRYAFKEVEFLL